MFISYYQSLHISITLYFCCLDCMQTLQTFREDIRVTCQRRGHIQAANLALSNPHESPSIHNVRLPCDCRRPSGWFDARDELLDSSYFKKPGNSLPTPAQVRALSKDIQTSPRPKPIIFENSGVFVKFGPHVTIAEDQCLRMLKWTFGDEIPVPEIFWVESRRGELRIPLYGAYSRTDAPGWLEWAE